MRYIRWFRLGRIHRDAFFWQPRMIVLLSRMPMRASTVASPANLLQNSFKNRGMMGETLWILSVARKCACPDSQFCTSHLALI